MVYERHLHSMRPETQKQEVTRLNFSQGYTLGKYWICCRGAQLHVHIHIWSSLLGTAIYVNTLPLQNGDDTKLLNMYCFTSYHCFWNMSVCYSCDCFSRIYYLAVSDVFDIIHNTHETSLLFWSRLVLRFYADSPHCTFTNLMHLPSLHSWLS